jgi:hypothetical protein
MLAWPDPPWGVLEACAGETGAFTGPAVRPMVIGKEVLMAAVIGKDVLMGASFPGPFVLTDTRGVRGPSSHSKSFLLEKVAHF